MGTDVLDVEATILFGSSKDCLSVYPRKDGHVSPAAGVQRGLNNEYRVGVGVSHG